MRNVRVTLSCVTLCGLSACGLPLNGLLAGPDGGAGDPDGRVESVTPDASEPAVDAGPGDPEAGATPDAPDETGPGDEGSRIDPPDGGIADGGGPDRDAGPPDAPHDGPAGDADSGPDAPPPGPPAFIQGNAAVPQTGALEVDIAFGKAQVRGHLNVVVVGWNDATASVLSVTDSAGNSYERALGPTISPAVFTQSIYFAKNTLAATAGNTVRVQFDVLAQFADVRIVEYAGISTVDPLDVAVGAAGNSATTTAGPLVTTSSDLLVAANIVATVTTGPGGGFTSRGITNPDGDIVEDMLAPLPGSYTATAPMQPAGKWVMQLVAFRAQ